MLKNKSCLAILTLLCLPGGISSAQAQTYTPSNRSPVADSTLGTQVTGTGNNFNITGGLVKGQTLFHSFTDFSVPTNGRVDFTNPVGNRDIITRVTGASFSDINGIVNTSGANFFLINPNGIVFGTGAQLNVGKAFVGSTASSLDLVAGNGSTINFGTNPSGDAPLLSVAPNVLFDVSRLNLGGGTGSISNFGTLQINNPNQYIGLIGGNVTMNGGQIISPGGRVEIGGLSDPGTVTLGMEENNLRAQFPTNVAKGDVSLANTTVNVSLFNSSVGMIAGASGSADIVVTGQNVEIFKSSIESRIAKKVRTAESVDGNINITANDKLSIDNSSIRSVTYQGRGGDINIATRDLLLTNFSTLVNSASAYDLGDRYVGDINIKATGDIVMDKIVRISNSIEQTSMQNGNINIAARNLSLIDDVRISSLSKLNIIATGNILLDASRILSSPFDRESGGNLNIVAQNLSLIRNAGLYTTIDTDNASTS
jgi:filamentous hemagglutinin family protein